MGNLRKALERAGKSSTSETPQRPAPGSDLPIVVSLDGVSSAARPSSIKPSLEQKRGATSLADDSATESRDRDSSRITSVLESLDRAVHKDCAANQLDTRLTDPLALVGHVANGTQQHPLGEDRSLPPEHIDSTSISPTRQPADASPTSANTAPRPRVFLDDIQPIRVCDVARPDPDAEATAPTHDDAKADGAVAEPMDSRREPLASAASPPTNDRPPSERPSTVTSESAAPSAEAMAAGGTALESPLPPVQTITTDDADVADPIGAANAITGPHEPDDLATPVTGTDDSVPNPQPDQGHGTPFERSVVKTMRLARIRSQYQQLWDNMCQGIIDNRPAVISVVSPEPENHLSRILGHLGVLLSHDLGKHVLLVDGDLRSRTLSSEFGAPSQRGLAQVCRLKCDWEEVVIPTSNEQLSLLPAGDLNLTAGEIDEFFLPNMALAWKKTFDVVLIDGGDAQASFCSPILRACDQSYLLVRLGRTNRDFADEIVQSLKDDEGVQLDGCIVTNLP